MLLVNLSFLREKDGLWACLAWLSVLAHRKLSVEEICTDHWSQFGRNVFTRYDYENCSAEAANKMMDALEKRMAEGGFAGTALTGEGKSYKVAKADNFCYTDPIDKSVSAKQVTTKINKNYNQKMKHFFFFRV